MKILEKVVIRTGFKLLAHAFHESQDHQGIVGVNGRELVLMLGWNSEENAFEKTVTKKVTGGGEVINIISQTLGPDENQVLVTTKDGEGFASYLVGFDETSPELLFRSQSTPILVADPNDLSPLLIYSPEDGKIQISSIWDGELVSRATHDVSYSLRGVHTSWFLDLTGDMHADLALHITDGRSNSIHILRMDSDYALEPIQTINLASEIGPIIFSEMTSMPGIDMMYVSKENGEFYLNLHENLSIPEDQVKNLKTLEGSKKFFLHNNPTRVYDEVPTKTKLSTILHEDKPLLREQNGSPTGIFLADIMGSGRKDVYLLAGERLQTRVKVLRIDPASKEFVLADELTTSLEIFDRVTGISVTDLDASGKESLLINTIDDSGNHQLIKADIEDPAEKTGLTLVALVELPCKRKAYVPGASFFMVYENHGKMVKVSQCSQSSYPSLQRHREYVGLGPTNLFLNFVSVSVPHADPTISRFDAVSIIVPNTLSVFIFDNRTWVLKSFFSKLYYFATLYGVFGIFVVFFFIYLVLSFQEMRKYKTVRSRDSMRPIFIAL